MTGSEHGGRSHIENGLEDGGDAKRIFADFMNLVHALKKSPSEQMYRILDILTDQFFSNPNIVYKLGRVADEQGLIPGHSPDSTVRPTGRNRQEACHKKISRRKVLKWLGL